MQRIFLIIILAGTLSGCYPMPNEDDCCLIPSTNNPNITREKGGFTPSVKY